MDRRDLLATVAGCAVVAGCLGSEEGTEGNDDDPIEADPGDLVLPEDELDGDWTADDPESIPLEDPDAAVTFFPYDGEEWDQDAGIVGSAVRLETSVEAARGVYDDLPYHEGWEFDERPIAVESIGGAVDSGIASYVFFRDANAIGAIVYENPAEDEGTVVDTGVELAAGMHGDWRN